MRARGAVLPAALALLAALLPVAAKEGPVLECPTVGEFGYRMEGADGEPCGYARLSLLRRGGGRIEVRWELRIGWPGGSYEETREMDLGPELRLLAGRYDTADGPVGEGRREGGLWTGRATGKDGLADVRAEIPDDAATSLLFVLAAGMELVEGAELVRTELDEGNAAKLVNGRTVFRYVGREEVGLPSGPAGCHRIDMVREDGGKLPIWVSDRREIVMIDWGGGTVMKIDRGDVTRFFEPKPPAVVEVEGPADRLRVSGVFEGWTPAELFDRFTRPDLLAEWWAPEAEVGLREGGPYVLTFPEGGFRLHGEVRSFEPGRRLVFTWKWAHEPEEKAALLVEVGFEEVEGGTRLTITHGPYADTPEAARERKGHLEGWQGVLGRLKGLR